MTTSLHQPNALRQLILVRHGKSCWETPLPDHQRPLAQRGKKTVPLASHWLVKQPWQGERMLCSTAARTQQTAALLMDVLQLESDCLQLDQRLYEADPDNILSVINEMPTDISCLIVVGHNPGLDCLIELLDGPIKAPSDQKAFPTAAVARLVSSSDNWNLQANNTRLIDINRPVDYS